MGRHTEECRKKYRKERKYKKRLKKRDFRKNYMCNTNAFDTAQGTCSTDLSSSSFETNKSAATLHIDEVNDEIKNSYVNSEVDHGDTESSIPNPFDSCSSRTYHAPVNTKNLTKEP